MPYPHLVDMPSREITLPKTTPFLTSRDLIHSFRERFQPLARLLHRPPLARLPSLYCGRVHALSPSQPLSAKPESSPSRTNTLPRLHPGSNRQQPRISQIQSISFRASFSSAALSPCRHVVSRPLLHQGPVPACPPPVNGLLLHDG